MADKFQSKIPGRKNDRAEFLFTHLSNVYLMGTLASRKHWSFTSAQKEHALMAKASVVSWKKPLPDSINLWHRAMYCGVAICFAI